MTTEKTIDEQIKELQEQVDSSIKMPTQGIKDSLYNPTPKPSSLEKEIDEMIDSLQKQLNTYQEPPSQTEQIDAQIKSLQEQIDIVEETPQQQTEEKEIYKKEEKKLVIQLMEQETIIEYLSKQLEDTQKRKEDLEEKLKCLRYVHDL